VTVFTCAECGTALTAPLSQVVLPDHAHQMYGHELLGVLMEPGTCAVDPEPSGPPWRPWAEIGAQQAQARGVYAPVHGLSDGPPGAVALAPGDVRATVLIPERCDGYCCGLDGGSGPNLACAQCGHPVATRVDDCSLWQVVWLDPRAVRPRPGGGPARPLIAWEALQQQSRTPPVQPCGAWSPVWEAAVAVALARLLAASAGARVAVPGGLVADTFGRALDALLPAGPPAATLTLAGPGLPDAGADIALVPRHPQTGRTWPSRAGAAVPLAAEVWAYLAFQHDRRPVPGGGMPEQARRDDPLPLLPRELFRPDWEVLLHALARLPQVRRPWLRAIYDRVKERRYRHPFL
jgi:hypothetical protein